MSYHGNKINKICPDERTGGWTARKQIVPSPKLSSSESIKILKLTRWEETVWVTVCEGTAEIGRKSVVRRI